MTRSDFIAIAFALTLLPILYIQFWQPDIQATHANITDAHKHTTVTTLAQTQTLSIMGELGNSTFEVKQGQIRFSDSPCKAKYCVHRGWLKYSGEVMACLPNKVFVQLTGGIKKFDSINF